MRNICCIRLVKMRILIVPEPVQLCESWWGKYSQVRRVALQELCSWRIKGTRAAPQRPLRPRLPRSQPTSLVRTRSPCSSSCIRTSHSILCSRSFPIGYTTISIQYKPTDHRISVSTIKLLFSKFKFLILNHWFSVDIIDSLIFINFKHMRSITT